MPVRPIPEGYHTITPCISVRDAARQIEFLEKAFDAKLLEKHLHPSGKVAHAVVQVGDSRIMLSDENAEFPATPTLFVLWSEKTDELYKRALAVGATSVREPADMFYGDRTGGVKDMNGNQWWLSTHVEDVAPEELARRAKAMAAKSA